MYTLHIIRTPNKSNPISRQLQKTNPVNLTGARFSLDIFLRILSFELLFQSIIPSLAGRTFFCFCYLKKMILLLPTLSQVRCYYHPSLHSPPVSPPVHTQSEYSQKGNKLEIHAFLIVKHREKECLGLCASVLIL